MRVVANACFIVPGEVGGAEEYTVRLLRSVTATHPEVDVEVVASSATFAAHPALAEGVHHVVRGPVHRRAFRIGAESIVVPRLSRSADVSHHLGGRIPARRNGPTVATILDIQPIDLPANFSAVKRRFLDWALPRTVEGADVICVPTAWVGDRLIDRFSATPDRIHVVSPAPPEHHIMAGDVAAISELGDRPVVLYPAVTHPHKNHQLLLTIVNQLRTAVPDVAVVFTGGPGAAHAEVVAGIARVDPQAQTVRHLGRVPEPVIAKLLARADVVVFPSRYEGFGLPVLEAMAAGTPVVASDAACLPEVVGDGGLLVDPDDGEAWVDALSSLLCDAEARTRYAVAGSSRASLFTPNRAAGELVGAWRDAAA